MSTTSQYGVTIEGLGDFGEATGPAWMLQLANQKINQLVALVEQNKADPQYTPYYQAAMTAAQQAQLLAATAAARRTISWVQWAKYMDEKVFPIMLKAGAIGLGAWWTAARRAAAPPEGKSEAEIADAELPVTGAGASIESQTTGGGYKGGMAMGTWLLLGGAAVAGFLAYQYMQKRRGISDFADFADF